MSCGLGDLERRYEPAPMPAAALVVLAAGVCALWSLCLPEPPRLGWADHYDQVYFRAEWWVAATLLAIPLQRVARWRTTVGLVALAVVCGVAAVVADEGAERFRAAGHDLPAALVVGAVGLQGLILILGFAGGARARRTERRWARLSRRLATHDVPDAARDGSEWRSGDVRRHL